MQPWWIPWKGQLRGTRRTWCPGIGKWARRSPLLPAKRKRRTGSRGKNRYYRARGIYEHFPSLAKARAFQGSLNYLLDIIRKGIKGREAAPAKDKRLKAFMKAIDGDPEEAVWLVIERHWNFPDALKWFQKVAEQKGIK